MLDRGSFSISHLLINCGATRNVIPARSDLEELGSCLKAEASHIVVESLELIVSLVIVQVNEEVTLVILEVKVQLIVVVLTRRELVRGKQ